MRRHLIYLCLIALEVGSVNVTLRGADCGYSEALRLHWAHTRKMLTQIAAAMPEARLDYRPAKEVRSFREIMLHLVQDGTMHMATVAGASEEEVMKIEAKYANLKSRDELLKALNDFYDYGDIVLGTITDVNKSEIVADLETKERMTRIEAALMAFDDQVDHYGNFVVYLRMNDIVPPATLEAQRRRNSQ